MLKLNLYFMLRPNVATQNKPKKKSLLGPISAKNAYMKLNPLYPILTIQHPLFIALLVHEHIQAAFFSPNELLHS